MAITKYSEKTLKIMKIIADSCTGFGHGDKLDQNIIPLINALNMVPGMHTNWSCGGHPEKKRFPYVSFTFDYKLLGLDNLALIAHAASESQWIVSLVGRLAGEQCEGEFVLYPIKVIILGGNIHAVVEGSEGENIEAEQAEIDNIARKVEGLISTVKKSCLCLPNWTP